MSAENQTHESSGSPSVEQAIDRLLCYINGDDTAGSIQQHVNALLAACRAESAAEIEMLGNNLLDSGQEFA